VVSFKPRPLYPRGKRPWYPLDRKLGGPQSWSGQCGEEKILDPTMNGFYIYILIRFAVHTSNCKRWIITEMRSEILMAMAIKTAVFW
jgi:hypothetical protein